MISIKQDARFTFDNLESYFTQALLQGYDVVACQDYLQYKKLACTHKILVNRVDIDFSVKKAEVIVNIFNKLKIKATFFIRLHAPEYNPFSFENYRILKWIRDSGHEIGYHSEIIDQSIIWNEPATDCLLRDIAVLEHMLGAKIVGVASHSGHTGFNNLDFWKGKKPIDFGLLYEAYDTLDFDLFNHSLYVSDSNWTYWKCYDNGKLRESDKRTLGEHTQDNHQVIYSLIHPETYFNNHFYE
jgi:hypothetical protein